MTTPSPESPRSLSLSAPVEMVPVEASADGGAPVLKRFAMSAYTGGAMSLRGWRHPTVIDLAGLAWSAKPRPILKDHNPSLIVGHTESVSVVDGVLRVAGVVSGGGAVAREIVDAGLNGFPWQASVGAHAVATVEESFFERRYVGDQAGPGLIARVLTQYDDVALYPPAYLHPTVGESKSNPDAPVFLKAAHLFAGTWVEENRQRYSRIWHANESPR